MRCEEAEEVDEYRENLRQVRNKARLRIRTGEIRRE